MEDILMNAEMEMETAIENLENIDLLGEETLKEMGEGTWLS